MKNRYYLLVLVIILIFQNQVSAQDLLIDSLRLVINKNGTKQEQKITAMAELGKILRYSDIGEGFQLAQNALTLAYQQPDKYYASYVWYNLYYIYRKMDDPQYPPSAAVDSAHYYSKLSKDPKARVFYLYISSREANFHDNYSKSIPEAFEALYQMEKLNMYSLAVNICYSLEGTYNTFEDLKASYKYAEKGLDFALKANDPNSLAMAYLILGSNYQLQYIHGGKIKTKLDSSIMYYHKCYDTATKYDGYITDRFIVGTAALNTAVSFYNYFPDSYQDSSIHYLNEARKWASKINDRQVLTSCDGLMSEFLKKRGKYAEAETYLVLAIAEIESNTYKDYYRACAITEALARNAQDQGEDRKALSYYKQYMKFYTELHKGDKLSTVKEMEAQFEGQRQQDEILYLQKEKKMKDILNILIFVLITFCMIIIIFIVRSYRLKLNLSHQQKRLLQQENEEIVLRSLLAEEEAQRLKLEEEEARLKIQLKEEEAARLAAEQLLIQQKNEQLQKELLVGAMHLNQKNELLANLTDQIKQESVSSLQSINAAIKENLMLDKDFEQFKNNLQNLHPEFFGKLQQYADGKLTALDMKYCAYIYMKLSSKQIASTMHVEQKTVRMTKYRIKKKLGLDKDTDLDSFIENII